MTAKIGHHGVVRKAGVVSAALLLTGFTGVAFATGASAATCASTSTVTISSSGPLAGLTLSASPAVVTVHVGDCVSFDNSTKATVSVSATGSDSYGISLTRGAVTPPSAQLAATSAGADVLRVTSDAKPSPLPAAGAITILPALPIPVPTPPLTPSPKHNPKPTHTPKGGSATPTSGQSSTSTASTSSTASPTPGAKHSTKRAHPGITGISLPPLPPLPLNRVTAVPLGTNPLVAPGLSSPNSTATTTASEAAMVVAGPIEPLSGDGRGLPEAVAILLVMGLITGWGRVLLASHEAVDDVPRGGHRL
jgi:plastocyanin